MKAVLIYRHRVVFDDGAILEIIIWQLSEPVEGCSHTFKSRLFYGSPDQRIIGYDNERPKGDHHHRGDIEEAYDFESPEKLIDDFLHEVDDRRTKQ